MDQARIDLIKSQIFPGHSLSEKEVAEICWEETELIQFARCSGVYRISSKERIEVFEQLLQSNAQANGGPTYKIPFDKILRSNDPKLVDWAIRNGLVVNSRALKIFFSSCRKSPHSIVLHRKIFDILLLKIGKISPSVLPNWKAGSISLIEYAVIQANDEAVCRYIVKNRYRKKLVRLCEEMLEPYDAVNALKKLLSVRKDYAKPKKGQDF